MKTSTVVLTVLGSLWILAITVGMFILMRYAHTPSLAKTSGDQWPSHSQITLSKTAPTLIMFAHPHCACTRASIAELGKLVVHCKIKPKSYVLFLSPTSMPSDWEKTDLWHAANSVPGATVLSDINGVEAQKFNSYTSGQTIIYNTKGKLIFSGGITGARGQEGDNLGLNSAILSLQENSSKNQTASVFGCSLISSNSK